MYKAFQPQDAELHWDVVYNSLLCAMQGKRIHKGMELTVLVTTITYLYDLAI